MTREQQAAWDVVVTASYDDPGTGRLLSRAHALTLIDMMATPGVTDQMRGVVTMPEKLSDAHWKMFWDVYTASNESHYPSLQAGWTAVRDHLRKPPTRTEWLISGFGVNGMPYYSATARTADECAAKFREAVSMCARVEVVSQDVPA